MTDFKKEMPKHADREQYQNVQGQEMDYWKPSMEEMLELLGFDVSVLSHDFHDSEREHFDMDLEDDFASEEASF